MLRAADRTNSAGDAFVKLQARGRQATVYPPEQFTLRDSSPSGTVYSPEQFLRAGLCLAQELLLTFHERPLKKEVPPLLAEVRLSPAEHQGSFVIAVGKEDDGGELEEEIVWDREIDGGFPELKELKARVRDALAEGGEFDLGHSEQREEEEGKAGGEITEEEKEEMRRMWGVN